MTRVLERLALEAGSVPASVATNTNLAALDLARDVICTAALTLTLPSTVLAGWYTGTVSNDGQGLVTVAVPAGASLDGTVGGTLVLFPFQKAYFRLMAGGTAWTTVWIDRTPLIFSTIVSTAAPVASVDIAIPVGYGKFKLELDDVLNTTNNYIGVRFSDSGVAGLKVGSTDYYTIVSSSGSATTPSSVQYNDLFAYLIVNPLGGGSGGFRSQGAFTLQPGGSGREPQLLGLSSRVNPTPSVYADTITCWYGGTASGAIGRINLMRLLMVAGTFSGNISVQAIP